MIRKTIYLMTFVLFFIFSITSTAQLENNISNYIIDGNSKDWDLNKFEVDKETGLQTALTNDSKNLYIALKVSNRMLQTKLMNMGMQLYVDIKNKKKERTFIEFPFKTEGGSPIPESMRPPPGGDIKAFQKALRELQASTLTSFNANGFNNLENGNIPLQTENGIKIAFDWNEMDTMFIEYAIPLNFIENPSDLLNKTIAIGYKINGMDMPSFQGNGQGLGSQNMRGGGGRRISQGSGGGRMGGAENNAEINSSRELMFKELSFWTTYIFLKN